MYYLACLLISTKEDFVFLLQDHQGCYPIFYTINQKLTNNVFENFQFLYHLQQIGVKKFVFQEYFEKLRLVPLF